MGKKIISSILTVVMVFGLISTLLPVVSFAVGDENSVLIEKSDLPLHLQFDKEAPFGNEDVDRRPTEVKDDGWEKWSLPIGNGFFGVATFGRTETERLQITEQSLSNCYYKGSLQYGGLNNFSETYIDFGHKFNEVTNYKRELDLKTALSKVNYTHNGVNYSREYFTSYPDRAFVIRLDASELGKLSFTLRPTIPYEGDYQIKPGDNAAKHGTVTSKVENGVGTIELAGKMQMFDIDFVGLYRVVTDGTGTVTAGTTVNKDGDTDGTIVVEGAKSAYIVVTLGTDYKLSPEIFTSDDKNKPTTKTTYEDAFNYVNGCMNVILDKIKGKSFDNAYNTLKDAHIKDHSNLFGRVSLDINNCATDAQKNTDVLVNEYQKLYKYSPYLETLFFQYGRYLLIASSRPGTLPAGLQGIWNRYNFTPWSGGFWHNINIQMNYWPAFSTNLQETFTAYLEFNRAYMKKAELNATEVIKKYNPSALDKDGGNGWTIGTGSNPFQIDSTRSAGNLGFTTQLFWELYSYTQDKDLLVNVVFPILSSAARFITKSVELDEDGHYLVSYCDSPEQYVDGKWYYTTGTTYAQSFSYLNNYNMLRSAKDMGLDLSDPNIVNKEEYKIVSTVLEQLDKYDPIIVGLSGQIKEFREEQYYGDLGEKHHRHLSQLVGLYPGDLINANTPAWLDASRVTLENRGNYGTAWSIAHKLSLWARTKDGEKAYELYNYLLYSRLGTNLWVQGPFQLDGQSGGTAGVAEMLLQSHEGTIAPLAAIPEKWANGSYTGLVARGNFEVSAKWTDGIATTFNIKSNAGGRCYVDYAGLESATVARASDKRIIDKTVERKGVISFDTKPGETYIISNIPRLTKSEPTSELNCTREGLGSINLDWKPVTNASAYNVYVAVDSAKEYTLLGRVNGTHYTFTPSRKYINSRFTFAVTTVNAEGVESKRKVAYSNPADFTPEILDYEATVISNGELQVAVNASENAKIYKLWSKVEGTNDYKLVAQSRYPIIIAQKYDSKLAYGISTVSKYFDVESAIVPLDKIIVDKNSGAETKPPKLEDNILSGLLFTGDKTIHGPGYEYDRLTDGDYTNSGRFALKTWQGEKSTMEVTLKGAYNLSELKFYEFYGNGTATRITNIKIEVYYAGTWTVVTDGKPLSSGADRKLDTAKNMYYSSIDMGNVVAEKIRFTMSHTQAVAPTFFEIECSGKEYVKEDVTKENVLADKIFTGDKLAHGADYEYDRLTDGNYVEGGRFALKSWQGEKSVMEVTLKGAYNLSELKFYEFYGKGTATRITNIKIEVYYAGTWTVVTDGKPLSSGADRKLDTAKNMYYSSIDMGDVVAEKIRFTMSHTQAVAPTFYEIECIASKNFEDPYSNILQGNKNVTLLNGVKPNNETYATENMFDGSMDTRFAAYGNPAGFTVEVDLGTNKVLHNVLIYDFRGGNDKINGVLSTRSNETTIEVFTEGKWVTVINKLPLTLESDHTTFDLGGILGSKIRFTFNNTRKFDGRWCADGASIYEIKCTTSISIADKKPLLEAYKNLPRVDFNQFPEHESTIAKFENAIITKNLTTDEIATIVAEMNAFTAKIRGSENATLDAFNISLDGKIGVKFRYYLTEQFLAQYPDAYVSVSMPDNTVQKLYFKDLEIDAEGRYIVPVYVALAEVCNDLVLKVVYKEGVFSRSEFYSVKDYANAILAMPEIENTNPGTTELVKSMLNLAGYAQKQFGYNDKYLVNKGLYTAENDPVLQAIPENAKNRKVNVSGSVAGLTVKSFTLSLESETEIKIYFDIENGKTLADYTFTVIRPDGIRNGVNAVIDNGRVCVSIKNVNAKELSKEFKVEVTDGNTTLNVSASALSYVSSVLNMSVSNDVLKNLVNAIRIYSENSDSYNFQ